MNMILILMLFLVYFYERHTIFPFIMGYLHNPTDISENCVVRHMRVSYDTIFTDRINPIFCCTTLSAGLCKNTIGYRYLTMLLFRDFGLLHTDKLHILRETDQLGTLAKMIAINAFLQHGKK
jgi:hypothetical protein